MNKHNFAILGPNKSLNLAVGELLADDFGLRFVDSDALLEYEAGYNPGTGIQAMVQDYGKEYFYKKEAKHFRVQDTYEDSLFATSATTIMGEENCKKIAEYCLIILLFASKQVVIKRLMQDNSQHLKQDILALGGAYFENIENNIKPLADILVDTEGCSPTKIVEKIMQEMAQKFA